MIYRVKVKVTGRKGAVHAWAWDVAWRLAHTDAYPFSGVRAQWVWAD